MIQLFSSNRTECLVDTFASIISQNPLPIVVPEIVLIPTPGMKQFLSINLSKRLAICANTFFSSPAEYLDQLMADILSIDVQTSLQKPASLCWFLYNQIKQMPNDPIYEPILNFIHHENNEEKLFTLCMELALLFDHYSMARPGFLFDWIQGKTEWQSHEEWQAHLWLLQRKKLQSTTRIDLQFAFFHALADSSIHTKLPQRISLFGCSTLSQFHLELLRALSKIIPIYLFCLNPCKFFWDDQTKEKKGTSHQTGSKLPEAHNGNQLLTLFGRQTQQFIKTLHSIDYDEQSTFVEPDSSHVLASIQKHILNLTSPQKPEPIHTNDASLQIHACHTPLRQLEILHDILLSLIQESGSLSPHDICVLFPDIEPFANLIPVVFDDPAADSSQRLPFVINDSQKTYDRETTAFFELCEFEKNNFSVSHALKILESNLVKKTFSLSEGDCAIIQTWIKKAHIHWGLCEPDAEFPHCHNLHASGWDEGFHRLFLGYAMNAHGTELFENHAVVDGMMDSDGEILGKFYSFIQQCITLSHCLQKKRSLAEWSDFLLSTLIEFFGSPLALDLHRISIFCDEMKRLMHLSGCENPLNFSVVLLYLKNRILQKKQGGFTFSGGIVFSQLTPGRCIPFKIICICGMDTGSFPRKDVTQSFDLTRLKEHPLDRTRLHDDYTCFLETLLSAQTHLLLFYQGFDPHDNSICQPSSIITELVEYCQRSFFVDSPVPCSMHSFLYHSHRLTAHTEITEPQKSESLHGCFTYKKNRIDQINSLKNQSPLMPPFITKDLFNEQSHEHRTIPLHRFLEFYTHPVAYFLSHTLQLKSRSPLYSSDDFEPFLFNLLDHYTLQSFVLKQDDDIVDDLFTYLRAWGLLPAGQAAHAAFIPFYIQAKKIVQCKKNYLEHYGQHCVTHIIMPNTTSVTIQGSISMYGDNHLIRFKPARLKATDRLNSWLLHTLSQFYFPEKQIQSTLIGFNEELKCSGFTYNCSHAVAAEYIASTVALFLKGQKIPLPLYPQSSCLYAELYKKSHNELPVIPTQLIQFWNKPFFGRADALDPSYRITPNSSNPFDHAFIDTSLSIFTPLLNHEKPAEL